MHLLLHIHTTKQTLIYYNNSSKSVVHLNYLDSMVHGLKKERKKNRNETGLNHKCIGCVVAPCLPQPNGQLELPYNWERKIKKSNRRNKKVVRSKSVLHRKSALQQLLIVQFICDVEQREKKTITIIETDRETENCRGKTHVGHKVWPCQMDSSNTSATKQQRTVQCIRESNTDNNIEARKLGLM